MRYVTFLAVSLVVVLNLYLLTTASRNFPIGDDYGLILRFLNDWLSVDDFRAKVGLLITHHNEHMPLLGRGILLSLLYTTGQISFPLMSVLGFMSLCVVCYSICEILNSGTTTASKPNARLFIIATVCCLVIQPQLAEAIAWPTVAITVVPGFALSLLAFVLGSVRKMPRTGFFLAVCGAISAANGYVGLLFYGLSQRANPRLCMSSCLLSVGMLGLACHNTTTSLQINFTDFVLYLLSSLGSGWAFGALYISIAAGVLLLCASLVVLHWSRFDSALFWALLMLLAVAVLQALARCHLGLDSSIETSRYRIVSLLISAIVLAALLAALSGRLIRQSDACGHIKPVRVIGPGGVIIVFFLAIGNSIAGHILFWDEYRFWGSIQEEGLFRWSFAREATAYASKEDSTTAVAKAYALGYFSPKDLDREQYSAVARLDLAGLHTKQLVGPSSRIVTHLDRIGQAGEMLLLRGDAFIWNSQQCEKVILIVQSDSASTPMYFETQPRTRVDVRRFHEKNFPWRIPLASGILTLIPNMDNGSLRVGCYLKNTLYLTHQDWVELRNVL